MDISKANRTLSKAVTRLMLDENELLEQENIDPAVEAFDSYFYDVAVGIAEEYNVVEDDAWDILDGFLSDMVDSGVVPEVPENEDPEALTEWMTKAKQLGLPGKLGEWVKANVEFD